MGLDAEVIRVCAWEGFVYLMKISCMTIVFIVSISYRCVERQPCVSVTLFLLFLLYVCYPFAFWLLVYSAPVAACIYILLRRKVCPGNHNLQFVKDEENSSGISSEKLSSASCGDRTFNLNGKTIASRRSRKRIILQSADSNDPTNQLFTMLGNPLKFEERKMDILWGGDHSSLNSPFVDEQYSPNGDHQVSEHFVSDIVSGDCFSESLQRDADCGGHLEAESPEEPDNEDEDATEDVNKGVEWTEDDQKNLMDLGNSEIERNKRLESLMAKRRVKKLLSMQLQREPNNFSFDALSEIAPIAIGKTSLLLSPSAVHGCEKLPGSAPSVMVPMRNPFDLPYDPQEERPNLTGDGFVQEFVLVDARDLNSSQHESFDVKAKFPGEPENIHTTEKQESEGLSCSTFTSQQDSDPREKLFQPSLSIDVSMSTTTDEVKVLEQKEEISPALSREDGEVDNHDQDEVLDGPDGSASKAFIDSLRKSLIRSRSMIIARGMRESLPVNQCADDPDSTPIENTKMLEDSLYEVKQNRASRHSIASDLQVEVSDSSPPLTVGTISPPDGEISIYDVDIETEVTSGIEGMWGASSHLSSVEENESRSRVVHEISEEDIMGLGFHSEDLAASVVSPKKVVLTTRSPLPPGTNRSTEARAHPGSIAKNILDEIPQCLSRMSLSHIEALESSTEVELSEVTGNFYNPTLPTLAAVQSELLDEQVPVISFASLSSSSSSAEGAVGPVIKSNVQQPAMDGGSCNENPSALYLIMDENKAQTECLDLLTIPSECKMKEPIGCDKEMTGNATSDVIGDSKALVNLDGTVKLSPLAIAADTEVITGKEEEISKAFVSREGNANYSIIERNSEEISLSLGAEESSSSFLVNRRESCAYEPVEQEGSKKLTEAKIAIQDEATPDLSKLQKPEVKLPKSYVGSLYDNETNKKEENIRHKLAVKCQPAVVLPKYLTADAFVELSKTKDAGGLTEDAKEIKTSEKVRGSSKETETAYSVQDVGSESKDLIEGGPVENNLSRPKEVNVVSPLNEIEATTAQEDVEGTNKREDNTDLETAKNQGPPIELEASISNSYVEIESKDLAKCELVANRSKTEHDQDASSPTSIFIKEPPESAALMLATPGVADSVY